MSAPAIRTVVGIHGLPATGGSSPSAGGSTIGIKVTIAGLATSGGGTPPADPTPVDPLTLTLSSPAAGAVVADTTPSFAVGVDTSLENPLAGYTLHLQYATDQAMTAPTELTAGFTAVDAGAYLTPATAVPATTWWRARVAQGTTWRSAWSTPQSFTVSTTLDSSQTPVTWTVSANATVGRYPHLWYLVPSAAAPGDRVTVYGNGFPDNPGTVWLGGQRCTVNSWTFKPQVGNPDNTRHITGTDVTPEHYEVVITVPGYDTPGGLLEVDS